jgi:PIN like domain
VLGPAEWYFDANTIGLAKVLSLVRRDVTWPGDDGQRGGSARNWLPASPIRETAVKDSIWIPTVTEAGMRIVTRDHRIQTRLLEVQAVRTSKARMFAIKAEEPQRAWDILEVAVSRWRDMEQIARTTPGPFIAVVTRTTVRLLDI